MIGKWSNRRIATGLALSTLLCTTPAVAAPPTAAQALSLSPVQKDIQYDAPSQAQFEQCTIKAEKDGDHSSWVVRDAEGQILRRFTDSNADNVVDQWSYYAGGLEVYRDIDSNFNNKADQYRWFHTGGSRWGLDTNEDGKIDAWRLISAEEVAAEVVAAVQGRDAARFAGLLITVAELKSLGLGPDHQKQIEERIAAAPAEFRELATRQQKIASTTKYVDFGSAQPGVVPAGTAGSTKDLMVYESVAALVENGGKHDQVLIGTLVRVGDTWRLIDIPQIQVSEDVASTGHFFQASIARRTDAAGSDLQGPSAKAQQMMAELEKLDADSAGATPAQLEALNRRRSELLEGLAEEATDPTHREQWVRQFADTVSAAVQSGNFAGGVERLTKLEEKLAKNASEKDLAAYVKFRRLSAEYGASLQDPKADYVKVQSKWIEDLEAFVEGNPQIQETAEAMLQLAIAEEFAGQDDKATKWYTRIVSQFPKSTPAEKAAGAARRLNCVGEPMTLRGTDLRGSAIDLAQYKGHVVLIQYWATWCEPCKADMSVLKDLKSKYAKSRFEVIGVSLDNSRAEVVQFANSARLPWPQIYEEGGLESRLANELGILTLPTMILVDGKGNVVNRGIHITELEGELKKLLP
ncbi:MAG: redoxin family protein [Pirellulales bacterium]